MLKWLVLSAVLRFGFIPMESLIQYDPMVSYLDTGSFTQKISVEAEILGHLTLWGGMRVQDWFKGPTFIPVGLWSFVGARVEAGPVSLSVEYQCAHPVMPYQALRSTIAPWDASRLEIYGELRIGGEK